LTYLTLDASAFILAQESEVAAELWEGSFAFDNKYNSSKISKPNRHWKDASRSKFSTENKSKTDGITEDSTTSTAAKAVGVTLATAYLISKLFQ
jgi:hypothetical protein